MWLTIFTWMRSNVWICSYILAGLAILTFLLKKRNKSINKSRMTIGNVSGNAIVNQAQGNITNNIGLQSEDVIRSANKILKPQINTIEENSAQTLQRVQDLCALLGNSNISIIKPLIPELHNAILSLKVKTANKLLLTIKKEADIHCGNNNSLLATIEYHLGLCSIFTNKAEANKHFSEAYRLMKTVDERKPEILEAMIFISCKEKKYDLSQKFVDELLSLNPNSYWSVIPQLITSENLAESYAQIPKNIDGKMAIATVIMLGSWTDKNGLGVNINSYQFSKCDYITIENLPLWVLDLSVSLTRFFHTFKMANDIREMYNDDVKTLHEITTIYLKEIEKTEINNPLPDTIFINALTGYMNDQNSKWLDIMKDATYSSGLKEIYYLGYAFMLNYAGKNTDATLLLKGYGSDAPSSILGMRLQLAISVNNIEEMKEVFKFANKSQCIIPDYIMNTFLAVIKVIYEQLDGNADSLNIENPLTKRAVTEYLKFLRKENVDIYWLESEESRLSPVILPFLACIYEEKISLEKGIKTLEKCVDKKVLDLRSNLLIEFMSKDNSYTSRLYNFLKELRKSSNDINNYNVSLLYKELQYSEIILDYQNSLEIITQMLAIMPNDEGLIVHHILALYECGGCEEKIKSYEPKLLDANYSSPSIACLVDIYHNINEPKFALELLYRNIKRTNNQSLKDMYVQKQLNPAFDKYISNEKEIIEESDYITLTINGSDTIDIEISPSSIYETLIGKTKGDVCQLDINGIKDVEIIQIRTKYYKLLQDIHSEIISCNASKRLKVFNIKNFNFKTDPIGALREMIGDTDEICENKKLALSSYQRGELPLMKFVQNDNLIVSFYNLLFGDFAICTLPNIFFETIIQENRLKINTYKVVLDISSLIMLHEYDEKFGLEYDKKFYIPRRLAFLIQEELKNAEKELYAFPKLIQEKISIKNHDLSKTFLWNKLKMLSEWINNKCEILLVEERLNYNINASSSLMGQITHECLLLAKRGYLMLTEDCWVTKKNLKSIFSMSVSNWLSLMEKSHINEYAQEMLEAGNLGYPITADYIVKQYKLFCDNVGKNHYATCCSNLEQNPMTYEEFLKAGEILLGEIVDNFKITRVTKLFYDMFYVLEQEFSSLIIYNERLSKKDELYYQCLLNAFIKCYPIKT